MMILVLSIVDKLFLVYFIMLFARILSSWLPQYSDLSVVRFIAYYTDPYLNLFRRIIPPLGMLDISPIVAFFALNLIEGAIKWGILSIW